MNSKKKRKKWPWALLAIVIVVAIVVVTFISNAPNPADIVAYDNYTVTKGSITSTVTGSGKLESVNTENIDVPDGIIISEILVRVGDNVAAGDTLATLDADSLKSRAAYLSGELSSLDNELARMGSNKTTEYVYASVKGRIKYLPVSTGSDVISSIAEYGTLALISTDGLMQVEITGTQALTIFSEVIVKWQDGSDTGEVAEKTANGYLITLDDDNALYNEKAQVFSGDTLLGEGTLTIHAPVAIYANGGTISKIHYDINDKVSANSKLFTLDNEPFSSSYQQKFAERTDMAKRLETVLAYQNNPRIVATQGGVISSINVTEGDETGAAATSQASSNGTIATTGGTSDSSGTTDTSSSAESTAFVINTGGALKMMVSVDELDIHSVALNQDATVTMDAIASEKFSAKVTHISSLGDADGSITTFSVDLTLSPDSRFLEGMNGNATILVDQVEGVLIIPVEAINEDSSGAFVYFGSNREKTYITTGLSDGEYAEVTSGLSEGDMLQYISSSKSSASSSNSFGGMQGGPFGGGMGGITDGSETTDG